MKNLQALFYLTVIIVIYLMGAVQIDLLDNDATQYMTIARNMHLSGDYMTVEWRSDYNYLDKPPLLFWLSAFFFSFLGVSHFAYRLPSILFTLIGLYATYTLGKRLYNEQTGLYASIIYAANFGIIVINHDVRTDTMLTGILIFTIWQLYVYLEDKEIKNFVLGFAGIGLAISAKGPLGLLIPAMALGPHLIYQKRWKELFRPEWLAGIVIVLIVLTPMIIGTYQQHGMHGIRFHFWSQSFGRITGDSKWEDTTGPFFFLHTFLWSFIPWSLLAVVAYITKWKKVLQPVKALPRTEIVTLSGITLVFIAMSMANYKLPHYIYVVFPLFAILTAQYIDRAFKPVRFEGFGRWIYRTQTALNGLLWLAIIVAFVLFEGAKPVQYLITYFAFAYFLYISINGTSEQPKLFISTLVTIIALAYVMNSHFYPGLNPYQARVEAGKYLKENGIAQDRVMIYPQHVHKPTIDVYSDMLLPRTNDFQIVDSVLKVKQEIYLFTDNTGLDSISRYGYSISKRIDFKDYQVSMLSLPFLNPKTRQETLQDLYLVKIDQYDRP